VHIVIDLKDHKSKMYGTRGHTKNKRRNVDEEDEEDEEEEEEEAELWTEPAPPHGQEVVYALFLWAKWNKVRSLGESRDPL